MKVLIIVFISDDKSWAENTWEEIIWFLHEINFLWSLCSRRRSDPHPANTREIEILRCEIYPWLFCRRGHQCRDCRTTRDGVSHYIKSIINPLGTKPHSAINMYTWNQKCMNKNILNKRKRAFIVLYSSYLWIMLVCLRIWRVELYYLSLKLFIIKFIYILFILVIL